MLHNHLSKSYRKFVTVFVVSSFVLTGLGTLAFAQDAQSSSGAGSTNDGTLSARALELKQSISDNQDEVQKIEAEIAEYQRKLSIVGSQKQTLQTQISTLDLTRAKLAADAKLTQAKIAQTNNKIIILNGTIDSKQEHIDKNIKLISDIIHRVDQQDSDTFVEVVLGNPTLSDFLQDIDDMSRLQLSLRDGIASLKRLKSELGAQKNSYVGQQKNLTSLNSQLADQKTIADQKRAEQNLLLKDTKNQESNFKTLLAQKEARKKQFEKEIDDFEAQLQAEIDPNSFPKSGTKVLAYPIDNPRVTQKFGKTVDSVRLYAAGTHNGVDFGVSPGTPVKAALDGYIIGTGDTDLDCKGASYGRWVMIKHKNGLSTMYGHFQLVKVKLGETVTVGQIIGYSGNTGYSTGPHLHFGLFVSSATQIINLPSKACPGAIFHIPVAPANGYLDPQAYL